MEDVKLAMVKMCTPELIQKKMGCIEILPNFFIQYPMKNLLDNLQNTCRKTVSCEKKLSLLIVVKGCRVFSTKKAPRIITFPTLFHQVISENHFQLFKKLIVSRGLIHICGCAQFETLFYIMLPVGSADDNNRNFLEMVIAL